MSVIVLGEMLILCGLLLAILVPYSRQQVSKCFEQGNNFYDAQVVAIRADQTANVYSFTTLLNEAVASALRESVVDFSYRNNALHELFDLGLIKYPWELQPQTEFGLLPTEPEWFETLDRLRFVSYSRQLIGSHRHHDPCCLCD